LCPPVLTFLDPLRRARFAHYNFSDVVICGYIKLKSAVYICSREHKFSSPRINLKRGTKCFELNNGLFRQNRLQNPQVVAAENQSDLFFFVTVFLQAIDQVWQVFDFLEAFNQRIFV
jgi:hypothetical protein